jgi:hypothetical protein
VKIAHRAPFFDRIGRVPTINAATVTSLPLRMSSISLRQTDFISASREANFSKGCPET